MFDLMPLENRNRSLFDYFDNMEKNFFGSGMGIAQFRTDVLDKGDKYVMQAELPGFDKNDIKIDLKGGYLTVSAEHNSKTEEKKENYVRRERRYGSFRRSFDVTGIDLEKIKAAYHDGILEVELPKVAQEPAAENRKIEIE